MTILLASVDSSNATIASAQVIADGIPRFQIPADHGDPEWPAAAAMEAEGGVSAEIRAFLDAQLETGDVLLDLAPGFGFVALSATTAPGGLPTVILAGVSDERLQALQDAAVDVGGWLESVDLDGTDLADLLDSRLDTDGRLLVHAAAADVPALMPRLAALIASGRVLAVCVTDAERSATWGDAEEALVAAGFAPCVLMEQDGDVVMVRVEGGAPSPVIALPADLVAEAPLAVLSAVDAVTEPVVAAIGTKPNTPARLAEPALNEDALDLAEEFIGASSDADDVFPAYRTPAVSVELVDALASPATRPTVAPAWNALRDGFSLISSHSRTGYGVTGAHLLRALQQRGVPVAFFPLGPVDRTLANNPQLQRAMERQDAYRIDVPSVRLSQQFDLAMHVGRGPHVAYTIFELDTFLPREIHHLASQDAIFVCSAWARQICEDNGLGHKSIHVVPLGVDRTVFHENRTPRRRWANETVFMQVGKLEPRKGQLDLLRAFERAFTPKDPVRLVLSCANPFVSPRDLDAMLKPVRKSPMAAKITVLTSELPTQADVADLMAAADCGVFAVRAEGWNLEALEMLSMGKQVIATDYSAHTEFLTAENARLVTVDDKTFAFEGRHPGRWAAWGERQDEQLVAHLRAVHAEKQSGALALNTAGIATATQFSWDSSADALVRSLHAIA